MDPRHSKVLKASRRRVNAYAIAVGAAQTRVQVCRNLCLSNPEGSWYRLVHLRDAMTYLNHRLDDYRVVLSEAIIVENALRNA